MDGKARFQEKLAELLLLCQAQGNAIEKSEVEEFFKEEGLSEEQMILVFDYLLAQRVMVKRYMKAGAAVAEEKEVVQLTEEEREYLKMYEADLAAMKGEELLSRLLPEVIGIAKEMNHVDLFIGDMIQEGNMGLMAAINEGVNETASLFQRVRESMQMFLESQTEMKRQDQKMADKVNRLEEEIQKLTEEMGRKITIDELSQMAEISEEEIEDILRMAGEEVGEIEEDEL